MEDVVAHSSSDEHGGVCPGSRMAWNCRGAGGKAFSTLIRDIKKEFNASFCILLETHISGQRGEAVWKKMGLMMVHIKVKSGSLPYWLLTVIYGNPQRINRNYLWDDIRLIHNEINLPWCLIRDFNAMLHDHERHGGSNSNRRGACPDFQDCVSDCGLFDLGYSRWPFTWKRGNLVERLDCGQSNLDWQIIFPTAHIKHLPSLKLDHSPLCLHLANDRQENKQRRFFRFQAAWLSHLNFTHMVNSN
ncbi:uncharacterized protein LOC107637209 [Arachis ipaensis]|uniref:uncharacterized protein LOC107637209 n=1 Tax=Arachis ipaensis TaxID=130454 RepID=UPI0007AF9F34|nr:uncharacterized protein LOC107637209 [Arachis ipaensis]XP_025648276.1 uncharacterized protein LOC112743272 [Arachis hypogaea]